MTLLVTLTTAGSTWRTTASTGSLPALNGVWASGFAGAAEPVPFDPRLTEQALASSARPMNESSSRRTGGSSMSLLGTRVIRHERPWGSAGSLAERARRYLLLRIDERDRRRRAGQLAVLGLDVECRPGLGELDGHPHVSDVLFETRRPH